VDSGWLDAGGGDGTDSLAASPGSLLAPRRVGFSPGRRSGGTGASGGGRMEPPMEAASDGSWRESLCGSKPHQGHHTASPGCVCPRHASEVRGPQLGCTAFAMQQVATVTSLNRWLLRAPFTAPVPGFPSLSPQPGSPLSSAVSAQRRLRTPRPHQPSIHPSIRAPDPAPPDIPHPVASSILAHCLLPAHDDPGY